jgi:CHAT domain-containing protein
VGRWIGRWRGYMRNRLAAGGLVTVAPKYKSASTRLSLAEATAQKLAAVFGARPVGGTLAALRGLLETPPDEPVALLYFTGHGVFNAEAASASAIKLEDGTLAVDEVARREVLLGERHGTLVFFNACEVGATAGVLGTVGGWADAFLSRRFRAFIAPLWAIDEEDAAQATQELMAEIVTDCKPVGAALRDLRAKYGDVSPTFFSYLLYGDVMARLEPVRAPV